MFRLGRPRPRNLRPRRRSHFTRYAAVALVAFTAGACVAQAPFPNIHNALGALASAEDSLRGAPSEFGGHKGRAMQYIHAARDELVAALSYRGG